MPGHVRSIDRRQNALRSRQRAQFLGRQHHAGHRGDVAEEDDARARRDGVVEQIQDLRRRLCTGLGSVTFFTTMP